MHESLWDRSLPYDGRIFVEGLVEWLEYRVLDLLGLFRGQKDTSPLHNDPYGAGATVLRWIEEQEGVQGVRDFMKRGGTPDELRAIWTKAGVTEDMLQAWNRAKESGNGLPAFDWVGTEARGQE